MPPMKGPAFIEGPVMVVAESVNMSAGLRFANPEGTRQEGGSLTLQVFTEPRLRVTRGYFETEAIQDDKGENLLLPRPEEAKRGAASTQNELQQAADYAWQLAVPIRLPVNGGTKLRAFRGKLHLFAHAETQRAEVADVLGAKEQTREVGGKRFTVHAVTPGGQGMYDVSMTLFRGDLNDEDWKWFHYPYGRVRLLDSRGRDLSPSSGGGGAGPRDPSASFAMQFRRESHANAADDQPGEPFKLVWDLPAKTRELVVPVSFEGLPLP